jgi:hypothetical protein
MVVKEHDKDPPRHEPPKHEAPKATERAAARTAPEVTPMNVSTPPEAYPYIDSLRLLVTVGPWKDAILHFPNADAAQAIADKWAVDFEEKPHDPDATPVPLTEAEYATALAAAEAYAAAYVEPPAEDPAARGAAPKGKGGHAR